MANLFKLLNLINELEKQEKAGIYNSGINGQIPGTQPRKRRDFSKEKSFYLKITDPKGLVFGGNVKAISSYNSAGDFDVLAYHTNFISIIKNKLILHLPDKTKKNIPLNVGILRCYNNIVDIYLGIEVI